jgi:hypothetical protein
MGSLSLSLLYPNPVVSRLLHSVVPSTFLFSLSIFKSHFSFQKLQPVRIQCLSRPLPRTESDTSVSPLVSLRSIAFALFASAISMSLRARNSNYNTLELTFYPCRRLRRRSALSSSPRLVPGATRLRDHRHPLRKRQRNASTHTFHHRHGGFPRIGCLCLANYGRRCEPEKRRRNRARQRWSDHRRGYCCCWGRQHCEIICIFTLGSFNC